MDMRDRFLRLQTTKTDRSKGGGISAVERQHAAGKLTAWERMELLFDPGSFCELDQLVRPLKTGFEIDKRDLPRDGLLAGWGRVDGRTVYAALCDFTVAGGSQGSMQIQKLARTMEQARNEGHPFVYAIDSGGRRLQDRMSKFGHRVPIRVEGCGEGNVDMFSMPMASGIIPQITLALGPGYAGTAYCPIMSDFLIFRRDTAFMSISSPTLIKSVTGADVTQEELGGALLHATVTGTADLLADSDEQAILACKRLLSYLPSNWMERPPEAQVHAGSMHPREGLLAVMPEDENTPLDMHRVISEIVDEGSFMELASLYAQNLIIGFARLNGEVIGVVANNAMVRDGAPDANSCDKQARFVRTCDCFGIPLVLLVDTPGFQPSLDQEQGRDGLARHAAKPVFALCEATVPKVVIYVRRCFGAARLLMGGRGMPVDAVLAWPSASMSPEAGEGSEPYRSASLMAVEDVIDPRETRTFIARVLERCSRKLSKPKPWRKHGLIPL